MSEEEKPKKKEIKLAFNRDEARAKIMKKEEEEREDERDNSK